MTLTPPGLEHAHLTREEIRDLLRETESSVHHRLLFHLLAHCRDCAANGRELMEALERGDFRLGDARMVIDTAVLEHRAARDLERLEAGSGVDERVEVAFLSENPWGWAVELAQAGVRWASRDPERAGTYAQLAILATEELREDGPACGPWNRALQAFAWAAAGNAARARRDHQGASTAFTRCIHFLESVREDAAELPYRARAFDLLASYHRDLGGVFTALDHLDSAIFLAEQVEVRPDPDYPPRLLLEKSRIQADLGDFGAALTSLAEADRALAGRPEGRLHAWVAIHRLYALVEQEATEEARGLLPLAEALAERHLAGAGLPRHRWVEGRLLRQEGALEEAATTLHAAFEDHCDRKLGLDAAFVLLDLAEVYLLLGRPTQVQELALTAAPLLQAQGLRREQLACLRLFFIAAREQSLEVALLRELGASLRRVGRARDEFSE
jgi:tetratricopeptide (TPR) repeat protein